MMAYGDYSGPDLPGKGIEGARCNRSRCQAVGAVWYNHGSHSWYCESCRNDIEFDEFNLRDWQKNFQPQLGHPMFETREQMDTRRLSETCAFVAKDLR